MSATSRGAERREADAYYTPGWCVERLLEACVLPGGRWLEPAVGGGDIVRAVDAWRSAQEADAVDWTTVDIRPEVSPSLVADFGWWDCPWLSRVAMPGGFNVCLTNPPYSLAMEYMHAGLHWAQRVALLLRLNWLASHSRSSWLTDHCPDVYVLPNRPSFTGDGGFDACEYAWMIWRRDNSQSGSLRILKTTPLEQRGFHRVTAPWECGAARGSRGDT